MSPESWTSWPCLSSASLVAHSLRNSHAKHFQPPPGRPPPLCTPLRTCFCVPFLTRWATSRQGTEGGAVPLPGVHRRLRQQDPRGGDAVPPPSAGTHKSVGLVSLFSRLVQSVSGCTDASSRSPSCGLLGRTGRPPRPVNREPARAASSSRPTASASSPSTPTSPRSETACRGETASERASEPPHFVKRPQRASLVASPV